MAHPTIVTLIEGLGAARPSALKALFAPHFRHVNKFLLKLYRASVSSTGVVYSAHTKTEYLIRFTSTDSVIRFHIAMADSVITNIYEPNTAKNMKQQLDSTSQYLHSMVNDLSWRIAEQESYTELTSGELTDRVAEDHLNDLLTVRHFGDRRMILEYSLIAEHDYYAQYTFVNVAPDDWLIEDCVVTQERLSVNRDVIYDIEGVPEEETE